MANVMLPRVEIVTPDDENEIVNVAFSRQSVPFALAVTNRAVYVPVINRWSLSAPWSLRRVPLEQVQKVFVRRTRSGPIVALSAAMVIVGVVLAFIMMALPRLTETQGGETSVWPFVIAVAGCILPFTARGRRTLRIQFTEGKPYEWNPPLFAADMTKSHVAYLIEQVVKGFRSLKIYVHED